MIKILDLFSGIGGFADAAISAFGEVEHVGMCEIDAKCREILRRKYPDVKIYDDVVTTPSDFEELDLVVGGFPCQPFSRNGKNYNFGKTINPEDPRTNLFLNIVRILQVSQPKAFLLENVKELLTIKNINGHPFLDTIISELDSVGYSVNYKVMSPTDFGVPQQRHRVFFVGIRKDVQEPFNWPTTTTLNHVVADYLDNSTDPKYLLSNQWRNRKLVKNPNTTRLEALQAAFDSGTWKPVNRSKRIEPLAIIYGDTPSGLPRQQDKLYSINGICPTLATFSTPNFDAIEGWRVLSPRECLRLQSFAETHPILHADSETYKQAGNAVNVEVVTNILKNMSKVFGWICR